MGSTRKIGSNTILAITLLAGCEVGEPRSTTVDINEQNELGLIALQTERVADEGNDVFMLHAFTADGLERASIRLVKGAIADLPRMIPGDSSGSEIVVSIDGTESRMLTRETQYFVISPDSFANPAVAGFLGLAAVSSTLEREAHIISHVAPTTQDRPLYVTSCGPGMLLTTPTAYECCYDGTSYHGTVFHRADESISQRYGQGGACTAYGGGACNGASCYYGPFGFARANIYTPSGDYRYAEIRDNGGNSYCYWGFARFNPPSYFNSLSGWNAPGTGCPGGATGAGDWDY